SVRYTDYRFLRNIEKEREVPLISDADLGMPIELGIEADGTYGLGAYWQGDRKGHLSTYNNRKPGPETPRGPSNQKGTGSKDGGFKGSKWGPSYDRDGGGSGNSGEGNSGGGGGGFGKGKGY
ncbi:hypothetical protein PTTG_07927, partial [Puccinia triticina 1-1 BBBD Race 1]|uniref:Uncharacterized protein n=1 Tax=Puccinia triticina (isolate 1-1 / race 1 (BBBD)) TaxID=630390 RepID=A0A0C4F493_PUCT1